MTKAAIVNIKSKQRITGEIVKSNTNEFFNFVIDGTKTANSFRVSEWIINALTVVELVEALKIGTVFTLRDGRAIFVRVKDAFINPGSPERVNLLNDGQLGYDSGKITVLWEPGE